MTVVDRVESTGALIEAPTLREPPRRGLAARAALVILPPLVLFGVVLGVWYFISYRVLAPRRRFLLQPPHKVLVEGFLTWENLQRTLDAAWSSVKVASIGLAIAIVLGVAIATLMSQAKIIERAVFPLMVALQAIPILALVPLINFWFGTGQTSRVIVCVIISVFPITLNTLFGLSAADAGLHDLVTLHRASRWTRLRKVMFPSALPAMFAGLRISAGLSVIGAIVGDMFFGRGEIGLGQLIRRYHIDLEGALLLSAIIVASLIGIAVFLLFGALQNAATGKWHDSKSGSGR